MLQTPFATEFFNSATSITIPTGWNYVEICCAGAGGSGRLAGGGSGAVAQKKYRILAAEWGTTLSCSVGVAVVSGSGGATTVDGVLNGATITRLSGGGGAVGVVLGGAGGVASGGDTNTDGNPGTDYDGSGPTYGEGGECVPTMLTEKLEFTGQGGNGGEPGNGNDGFPGVLQLIWSL